MCGNSSYARWWHMKSGQRGRENTQGAAEEQRMNELL